MTKTSYNYIKGTVDNVAQAPEVVPISTPLNRGVYETRLYKGMGQNGFESYYDDVIVLAPGWLGSGTLHFAATTLAREGHDVAVVSHHGTSLRHPNKDRSKHVHFAARAASRVTGKRGIIMIGHSNGNQDIHHAAEQALKRQIENPEDEDLYLIKAIGSMAGDGLSGQHISLREAGKQLVGGAREFIGHPINELDVVARSVANFFAHPILSVVEGLGATQCDVRPQASKIINTTPLRAYIETYFDGDGVIPVPTDRNDFEMMSGSHLTPVVCAETITSVAERLYDDNEPDTLQIARYAA